MRIYKCDLCGEQVQSLEDIYQIEFSRYGSSGTIHDYFDACNSCEKVVRGTILKMIEDGVSRTMEKAYNKT